MRIALINPVARRCQGYHTIGSKIPQLGLQVLADLTPPPHTVDIIDEVFGFEATERFIRRGRYAPAPADRPTVFGHTRQLVG